MRIGARIGAACSLAAACFLGLTGDFGPRDEPMTEGIPPAPRWLQRAAGPYSWFRRTRFVGWHPSRLEMLVETYRPHAGQLHRVPFPGARLRQLTFFQNWVGSATYPPNRDDFLVLSKDRDGDEHYQSYRYDLNTRLTTLLTDGKSRYRNGAWDHAGDRRAYVTTGPDEERAELYTINPLIPQSARRIASLPGESWSVESWSPDDRRLVLLDYRSLRESYFWLLDVPTGQRTLLTPRERGGPVYYAGGSFSRDGRGLYVVTDRGSEYRRLAYLDLATRHWDVLTPRLPGDVEDFCLSWDRKTIAFVVNEGGFSKMHLLDTGTRGEWPVDTLEQGVISNLGWHHDNRHLGYTFENAHHAPDAYSLDTRTGEVERWTKSWNLKLNAREFADPQLIRWRSFDGRWIPGFLYSPPVRFLGKRPVWIEIHGGPASQTRPDYLGPMNFYLNELGVALLFPNIRGSIGYGKSFSTLDDGTRREDAVKDIGALLDWIRARPDLDPDRVMVSGGSYGGYVALSVAARYPRQVRCVVADSAPTNLVTLLQYRPTAKDLRRAEYGDERDPKTRAFLQRIAPVHNARRIRCPVFLAHGDNDPRVPIGEMEQMAAALRKNGTLLWLLRAQGEGHGFRGSRSKSRMFGARVLFMKRYLFP